MGNAKQIVLFTGKICEKLLKLSSEENEVVIVTNVYGDVCLRKARRKRQKLLVRELMYDYAKNTTLHGLPYVTRTGLTLVEK